MTAAGRKPQKLEPGLLTEVWGISPEYHYGLVGTGLIIEVKGLWQKSWTDQEEVLVMIGQCCHWYDVDQFVFLRPE